MPNIHYNTPVTMLHALDVRSADILHSRKYKGRLRSLKLRERRSGSSQHKPGMIDFSSNDYLSITESPALRECFLETAQSTASPLFGSTGSRLLDGTTSHHLTLESRLAAFFGSPSALLFNSGWDANVSFFASIPQREDWVLFDELIHASVWDGMRSGRVAASSRRAFKHNDVEKLRATVEEIVTTPAWIRACGTAGLTSSSSPPVLFIAMESLYSMDGDLACLPQIVTMLKELVKQHPDVLSRQQLCIVVDEAHTTGLYGEQGRGFVASLGKEVSEWVDVRLMTFGKGVGSQGAVLLSSQPIRDFLINYARPFIFSTAMSVLNVLSIGCAWDVLQSREGDERRQRLAQRCTQFSRSLEHLCTTSPNTLVSLLSPSPSPYASAYSTPIQPILTPQPHALAEYLQALGYLVRPVVYPTVPKGMERVRVCLHADNEEKDLEGLVDGVREWVLVQQRGGGGAVKARL